MLNVQNVMELEQNLIKMFFIVLHVKELERKSSENHYQEV